MSFCSIEKSLRVLVGGTNEIDKEKIIQVLKSLDNDLVKNREVLPKKLIHFLEKRSYHKALEFIEESGDVSDE